MLRPEPCGPAVGTAVASPGARLASVVCVRPSPDPAAVEIFVRDAYDTHQRELFGFLLRATRDAAAAEDMVQESFLRLCRELQRGAEPPVNVRAWLYRVAGNLAVSRGRHATVARRWLDRVRSEEEAFEAPERTALRFERHEQLQEVLAELPRDQRVGLLMAAQGFSGHEVALALGRTDVSTRTMLCRARVRLRSILQGEEPAEDRKAG
jgi:RNA polymerase sigma-70 factor (ECF subfamily)